MCIRDRDRLGQHLVHGGDVVAVDEAAGHPVPDGLVGQGGGGGLLGQRDRYGEAVVLDEEDHRGLPDGREVQGLVEIALAGAAVAHQGEGDHVVAAQPGRVRQADRVRQLGGERGAQRGDPVLARVVAGVPVAAQQGQRLDGVESARHGREGVAVAREQPVLLLQDQRGRDLAGLLADRGGVHGEPPLLGEGGGLGVVAAAAHQLGVAAAHQLGIELLGGRRAQHPVRLGVREQRGGIRTGPPGGRRGGSVGRTGTGQLLDRHGGVHLLVGSRLGALGVPPAVAGGM